MVGRRVVFVHDRHSWTFVPPLLSRAVSSLSGKFSSSGRREPLEDATRLPYIWTMKVNSP